MNKKNDNLNERFQKPTRILAFDGSLKLKAIFQSYNAAEKITGIIHQRLLQATSGKVIAINKTYWREITGDFDNEFIIGTNDLNTLSLIQFDQMIGQNRMIYATRKMVRGEEILESQYKNRFQLIRGRNNKLWKKSK